jgi:hypothetical protein
MACDLLTMVKSTIDELEASLAKGEKHGCRFCHWHDCGDKCGCGCGQVAKEKRLFIEHLRYLLECCKTGEVPPDPEPAMTEEQFFNQP